ncbi:hypothetical protein J2801_005417 [Paraburkholderia phenoliruptrix]|uniref:hypothetical protein n=1 Tax=Paraburkholderia phenoliruptrix TaxID=252970 RepID=UPI002862127B|nr:hypothetical protein [Paraburkholderia phenoliruptrix]MDR6423115.1 hypothetical protein [Paraburkholderia phenoliruptrix]
MEAKSLIPRHIAPDLNQVRIALVDCARQLRYTARNVPGAESVTTRTSSTQASFPRPPLPQILGSVGHLADSLLETAETYAGHAIPPLQDHWKLPVTVGVDVECLIHCAEDTKLVRGYSAIYYAAAKRFVLRTGAKDVLIFEHRINDALMAFCESHPLRSKSEDRADTFVGNSLEETSGTFARLTVSLIDRHPIRSARFDELPDVLAPWWLVAEPNAYVFLLLGLVGCARSARPGSLPPDPDQTLGLAADIVGSRESKLRAALRAAKPAQAVQQELSAIVKYL